ncbi:MAG: ABC transporter permease [Bacteroidales bacterium]
MIRTFFKVTFRNLFRQPVYSIINIFGLAIGLTVFVLIMLYVSRELKVDKHLQRYSDIYRIEVGEWCVLPPGYGPLLEGQIPEVEEILRLLFRDNVAVKTETDLYSISQLAYADSNFQRVFPVEFVSGNPATALSQAGSMVISQETAATIFGDQNPVGQVLKIFNQENVKITGVFKKPHNSHLVFDALLSMETYASYRGREKLNDTRASNFPVYLVLNPGADKAGVTDKIYDVFCERLPENWGEGKAERHQLALRSLADIYFFKEAKFEAGARHGNHLVVYSFIAIAVFILLIACFNFINLTTARASKRSREVGLKKVVGAQKQQLIRQFLGESLVVTFIAGILALTLVQILIPFYNTIIGGSFRFSDLITPGNVALFASGILITSLISGLYPAFYLTAFRPVVTLKGEKDKGKGSGNFRKTLIILQFIISIVLIAGTITVFYQLDYLRNKPLGFDGEQVIVQVGNPQIKQHFDAYKAELLSNPNIQSVTFAHGIPGRVYNTETFKWNKEEITVRCTSTDPDYPGVMGIEMVSGRYFDWDQATDKYKTCVINETLAGMLEWENPVGKIIHHDTTGSFFSVFPYQNFKIIGVVKDFHFESLHQEIVPLAIGWNYEYLYQVAMKVNDQNLPQTLSFLENLWQKYAPEFPFRYEFLDQKFGQMYRTEERLGEVMTYFTILGIFIAALGLFGLSAYMAERRTKEIGVRKVLGASMHSIVLMLSKEFAVLVLLANVIAIPLAWYLTGMWLQDFPYRMELKPEIFVLALMISFIIAFFTVSYQSWKAAGKNPVDAVKYE